MKIDLACKCGGTDFEWEEPLRDSTVLTCTKCNKQGTKRDVVKQAEKLIAADLEKALKKVLR